ncbi:MAG TPA: GNAT family N-acetyltransferase [Candidatus Atribacteria bacterium]|nr:GNAT family N-acetyltransferase [Candidatus Atribacteria bacterium]HPT77850.1 GNAT family N-acetyltransferase [Candidatus Atribacteria bacterium]
MDLTIRGIRQEEYDQVYHFQCEYLDKETFDDFLRRVSSRSGIYLAAFAGDDLTGICYGCPSTRNRTAFSIQGIAVSLDNDKGYARKGIGSKLLAALSSLAFEAGYESLDVGAADDAGVEAFYIKNGFEPYELVAKQKGNIEIERVRIKDYGSGKKEQQRLREKHSPDEVIFIFKKQIK